MRSTKVYQSMQLTFKCKNNEEPNSMYEICASLKPLGFELILLGVCQTIIIWFRML